MRIAIVGAGFSGICLGARLRRAGFDDFTILEKGERVGGTWRENTYPGAACDIMSFAYCFSFAQKTDWSRKWAPQAEILGYLEECAERFGVTPHVRFGTEVLAARFDADAGVWRVRIRPTEGPEEEIEAEVLVSAVGQLHRPALPDLPGLADFAGACFHSAHWDPDVELAGKRVGVVGNAASAIQLVPEIARETAHLTVFQRTPNWHLPRGDRPYTEQEKRRFSRIPLLARAYRWLLWARQELLFGVMVGRRRTTAGARRTALAHLRSHVEDPELREALTPDYPIGAKRILIDDAYYATLARDDVSLVTSPIARVDHGGVVTADGTRHPLDVLVLATGFRTTEFLSPMAVEGLAGRRLEEEWSAGAEAYLGLCVAGYPNFFMLYGPNTNLGHNSIVFMIECQVGYVLRCLERIRSRELHYLDVLPEPMAAYNWAIQKRLRETAWAQVPDSWYKTDAGRITNNWAGTTTEYWWRTRRPDFDAYREVRR